MAVGYLFEGQMACMRHRSIWAAYGLDRLASARMIGRTLWIPEVKIFVILASESLSEKMD